MSRPAVFSIANMAIGLVRTVVTYTFSEFEDGRKADYDTHGVVISFLPNRKFEEHALETQTTDRIEIQVHLQGDVWEGVGEAPFAKYI